MTNTKTPIVLTIAGSDSGGGAGIQADLKTFAALGVYGTSAITAVTAQNTLGVTAVAEIPITVISEQINAVANDIGIDAVKTGMLSSAVIVKCVAEAIDRYEISTAIVDPVMISATGARLLDKDAVETVKRLLIPRAMAVTPNIPEAEELTGFKIRSVDDMIQAGEELIVLGASAAVIKGGHLEDGTDEVTDILVDMNGVSRFNMPRIDSQNNHGTGCTFASAIAANLALDMGLASAVREAQRFVWNAIATAPDIGRGNGPLNHMYLQNRP